MCVAELYLLDTSASICDVRHRKVPSQARNFCEYVPCGTLLVSQTDYILIKNALQKVARQGGVTSGIGMAMRS